MSELAPRPPLPRDRTSGTLQGKLTERARMPSTLAPPLIKEAHMNPTDHIQVVTFQLAGVEPDAYRAHAEASAPAFTEIPGLREKAWLAGPPTKTSRGGDRRGGRG